MILLYGAGGVPGRGEIPKYWTIVPKGYKKPIRLKSLGENYTEDAIKRRLTENQKVLIVPFAKETVRATQYRMLTREHKIKKVGGLYGLYLHYCYKLGYLPKYKKQNTARLHYLLKEDLLKLDKITQETRLLGRENISTDEQLFSYKESVLSQIKYAEKRNSAWRFILLRFWKKRGVCPVW